MFCIFIQISKEQKWKTNLFPSTSFLSFFLYFQIVGFLYGVVSLWSEKLALAFKSFSNECWMLSLFWECLCSTIFLGVFSLPVEFQISFLVPSDTQPVSSTLFCPVRVLLRNHQLFSNIWNIRYLKYSVGGFYCHCFHFAFSSLSCYGWLVMVFFAFGGD